MIILNMTLCKKLNQTRVSAPVFYKPQSGMNDNLDRIERSVDFNASWFITKIGGRLNSGVKHDGRDPDYDD